MTDKEKEYKMMALSLEQYVRDVEEKTTILSDISRDCVDNTYGNLTANEAAEKVDAAITEIGEKLDSIRQLIQYIQTLSTESDDAEKIDDAEITLEEEKTVEEERDRDAETVNESVQDEVIAESDTQDVTSEMPETTEGQITDKQEPGEMNSESQGNNKKNRKKNKKKNR